MVKNRVSSASFTVAMVTWVTSKSPPPALKVIPQRSYCGSYRMAKMRMFKLLRATLTHKGRAILRPNLQEFHRTKTNLILYICECTCILHGQVWEMLDITIHNLKHVKTLNPLAGA